MYEFKWGIILYVMGKDEWEGGCLQIVREVGKPFGRITYAPLRLYLGRIGDGSAVPI
jgi:hypothetical protein